LITLYFERFNAGKRLNHKETLEYAEFPEVGKQLSIIGAVANDAASDLAPVTPEGTTVGKVRVWWIE